MMAPVMLEDLAGGTATAHASAHTKGSWTTAIASTADDYDALFVILNTGTSGTTRGFIDIAVGGAGSEVVIASNLAIANLARLCVPFMLPVAIPAGSRVAVRGQNSTGGTAIAVYFTGVRGSLLGQPPGGVVSVLGVTTATTAVTTIDPGAVGSTYGSWVQLSASTPRDISAVLPVVTNLGNSAPQSVSPWFALDIGVGGAGSEVAVIAGYRFGSGSTGLFGPLPAWWVPVSIPAGSRVAARALSGVTDATDRLFGLALYTLTI